MSEDRQVKPCLPIDWLGRCMSCGLLAYVVAEAVTQAVRVQNLTGYAEIAGNRSEMSSLEIFALLFVRSTTFRVPIALVISSLLGYVTIPIALHLNRKPVRHPHLLNPLAGAALGLLLWLLGYLLAGSHAVLQLTAAGAASGFTAGRLVTRWHIAQPDIQIRY